MLNRNSKKMYLARKILLMVMIVSFTLTIFSACAGTAVEYFSAEAPVGDAVETAEVGVETDAVFTLADVASENSTSSVVKLSETFTYTGDDAYWTDSGNYDTNWYDSGKTSFEISSAAELAGLAFLVNAGTDTFDGDTITLTADIDLSAHEWTAIGSPSTLLFKGTFDGAGFEISGLYINITSSTSTEYQGLFGYILGGTVKNVNVADSYISVITSKDAYAGGIAGCSQTSAIMNCSFDGEIHAEGYTIYTGGIAGYNNGGTVINCYNTGDLSGNGDDYNIGGVVGSSSGSFSTVANCYSTGSVTDSSFGSVVGCTSSSGTVTNCYALDNMATNLIGDGTGTDCDTFGTDGYLTSGSSTLLVDALNAYVETNTTGYALQSWVAGE